MRIFTNILICLAIALIGVNFFVIDFNKPVEGDNVVSIIGIVASICAILIMVIFRMSKKIEDKLKG